MDATSVALILIGATAVLLNKPFGELCRRWQVLAAGRDYGLRYFRIPIIVIGSLAVILGLLRS